MLAGWYAGQGLVILSSASGSRSARLIAAGATALAAVLLVVAGLLAQRWCRLPPDDEGDQEPRDDLVAPPPQRSPQE